MLRRKRRDEFSVTSSTPGNVEMVIDSIRVSPEKEINQRVVILKEKEKERYLPVWVGPAEADAIAMKLQNIQLARPLTHDLMSRVIAAYGGNLKRVTISELRNNNFYAKLELSDEDKTYEIDCRPSDGIGLAVRVGAPIYVAKSVIEEAGVLLKEGGEPSAKESVATPRISVGNKFSAFSEALQRVFMLSDEKAKELGRDYVTTADLLLALSYVAESTSAKILDNIGVGQRGLQSAIETAIQEAQHQEINDDGLSSNVKKAISLATEEAKCLNSDHVCTECLLIGLVEEMQGIAAMALQSLLVTREKILCELVRILNQCGDIEHIRPLMQPL